MAKIICIANQKGGVGKTTTAVNLSACVAQLGKRVLLIDIDPQGNTTSGLGVNKNRLDYSVYDVLINDVDAADAVRDTMIDTLKLMPARVELAGAEVELVNILAREHRLKNAIAPIRDQYDYIFVDCPPSLGLLTLNALTMADALLVPIQCEYYALEGLSQLMNTVKLIRRSLNPQLEVEGVVLTMYDGRTNLSQQVVGEVKRFFKNKVYDTIIPRSVRLGEAPSFGLPISLYAPKSTGAAAYGTLAAELVEKAEGGKKMAIKKGLGRGLDALLESYEPGRGPATLQEVSVYDIDTNPDQPRKTFDEEKLQELAGSIKTHGIVQPLILYRQGNRYTIVAGERRYRAARLAGLKTVPAVITDKEEHELQEVSLIENLQREDLNPVEEAAAIRFLMVQHNLTQEEVSSRIGRSRPAVTNALRLLNLPESVQGMLKDGTLSAGHGKMLAGLEDSEKTERLAQKAVKEGWSVRQLEEAVRLDALPRKKVTKRMDPEIRRTASAIRSRLRAKVAIEGDQEKGKIIISYFSRDDLMNICDAILGVEE